MKIGCHLSSSEGYLAMGETAKSIGATTFQFFTRNPRGGKAKDPDPEDIRRYLAFAAENGISEIVAHAPYTINPCSDKPNVREFAEIAMLEDLSRLEQIPGCLYNFHPGCHVGQGTEAGIGMIAELLNKLTAQHFSTPILLETMAGKGSEIGGRFEELAELISRVPGSESLGVCLDTCHVFDGGYDIVNGLEDVLSEFDRIIGLNRLKALHVNDSKNPIGSHKDRHAALGTGYIPLSVFEKLVTLDVTKGLPMILETPNELPGYAKEIQLLQGYCHE